MRMLAIECATEACSLALFEGGALLDSRHEVLGRGHAEQLVPLIASLPGKGRAEEIRVSLGPGSFTGVRIGLAAARALGLAWGARVRGYPTLALVAATAWAIEPGPVTVCMAGGHGEVFVQAFGGDGLPEDQGRSLSLEAVARPRHRVIAGTCARELSGLISRSVALTLLPDACRVPDIPLALLTEDLTPIYGRGPDARLPA